MYSFVTAVVFIALLFIVDRHRIGVVDDCFCKSLFKIKYSAARETTVRNEGNIPCADVVGITNAISAPFSAIFRATLTDIAAHIASASMTALAKAAGAS
jgi:hypothetical protein